MFIDVGQGDSAFVTSGGYNILIDGGPDSNAESVATVLDRYRVKKLDLVIASHEDSDHIGGLSGIVESYDVKKIMLPASDRKRLNGSLTYKRLKTAIKGRGAQTVFSKAGDALALGDIRIDILSPSEYSEESNDNSLVAKISRDGASLLFTGDISAQVENKLISSGADIKCDVLKLSHHGSKTANTEEFLKKTNAEYAVLSLSGYNRYNLPGIDVVRRLESLGIKTLRTDENGTITLRYDGSGFVPEVEK